MSVSILLSSKTFVSVISSVLSALPINYFNKLKADLVLLWGCRNVHGSRLIGSYDFTNMYVEKSLSFLVQFELYDWFWTPLDVQSPLFWPQWIQNYVWYIILFYSNWKHHIIILNFLGVKNWVQPKLRIWVELSWV